MKAPLNSAGGLVSARFVTVAPGFSYSVAAAHHSAKCRRDYGTGAITPTAADEPKRKSREISRDLSREVAVYSATPAPATLMRLTPQRLYENQSR